MTKRIEVALPERILGRPWTADDVRREAEWANRAGSGEAGDLLYALWDALRAAPAGLPLHESADRDADNVPSEALFWCTHCGHVTENPDRVCGPCSVVKTTSADNVPSDRLTTLADQYAGYYQGVVSARRKASDELRAVMAVAGREQAELRAGVGRLSLLLETAEGDRDRFDEERLDAVMELVSSRARLEDMAERVIRLLGDKAVAEATIARVEALHVDDGTGYCKACAGLTDWPCPTVAALRGPEPTEDGA